MLKSQEFDRSDQVKGHPCTTLDYVTQRLKEQPVWLIGLFLFVAVLLVAVMLQILYNYFPKKIKIIARLAYCCLTMMNVNDKIQTGQVVKQYSNTNEYFEYNFSKVTYHHQQSHDFLLQERVRTDGHPQL